jgi:glycosyltransferase involved in cell wall biosynthesis
MKIGIMGTRGIPNEYGGFEQFTGYLSKGLASLGHDVYVYNPHHHSWREPKLGAVNIIHCGDPKNLGTAGQFFYDLNCINDARKREFDILLHLGYTSDSVWSFRWPRKTIHVVNMDGLEWKRAKYNSLTRSFLKRAESLAARKADHMVADSEGIREYLENKYKKKVSFIPYCAEIFNSPDESVLKQFQLNPFEFNLVVARMEPENNIDTIICGHLASEADKLVVIGNSDNNFGRKLVKKFKNNSILFLLPVFNQRLLNNLRYFSNIYFHGHSVGGTNPSLLEAMACNCRVAAHDNVFNRAILGEEGEYFLKESDVARIIGNPPSADKLKKNKAINLEKIAQLYSPKKIVEDYESLMRRLSLPTSN